MISVPAGCFPWGLPMSRFASLQGLGSTDVFLRESVVLTKQQQRILSVRQRSDSNNSTDGGHEGVITGCDAFSLRSSIADPREVAQPPLQSAYSYNIFFSYHPKL